MPRYCERPHQLETQPGWGELIQDLGYGLLQLVDIRLALIIGLIAFLMAVGIDSSGNRAEAADLIYSPTHVQSRPASSLIQSGHELAGIENGPMAEHNPQVVKRLRHSNLAGALVTGNRLTRAHFFTDISAQS